MARYTIFGDSTPSGIAYHADATAQTHGVTLGILFGWTPSLVDPRRLIGFRQWVTADQVSAGLNENSTFTMTLWGAISPGQPIYGASLMARQDFTGLAVGANDFFFGDPFDAQADASVGLTGKYALFIYYPPGNAYYPQVTNLLSVGGGIGQLASTVDPSGDLYVWTGQWGGGGGLPQGGIFTYGNPAGVAPQGTLSGQGGAGATTNWYGMDIIVDDIETPTVDSVGVSDFITVSRGGLPSSVTATGTATDSLSVDATDTNTTSIVDVVTPRVIQRSMLENNCSWGSYPTFNQPFTLSNNGSAINVGLEFHVEWDVECVGVRIYKPPLAEGSIPVTLWKANGTLLAKTIVDWVSDGGGWQEILWDNPVQLLNKDGSVTLPSAPNLGIPVPNITGNSGSLTQDLAVNRYKVAYLSPTGDYATIQYVFNAFAGVGAPVIVDATDTTLNAGGSCTTTAPISVMPTTADQHYYFLDPIVSWVDPSEKPVYTGDVSYWKSQWSSVKSSAKGAWGSQYYFPIAVFWPDQTRIATYKDFGITMIISGGDDIDGPGYAQAIVDADIEHVAALGTGQNGAGPGKGTVPHWWTLSTVLEQVATWPDYSDLVLGYYLVDEPDQGPDSSIPGSSINHSQAGYQSPELAQQWLAGIRTRDSTRPIAIGLDHICAIQFGTFIGEPVNEAGNNPFNENERRKFGQSCDILGGDWYITYPYGVPLSLWQQYSFVRRLKDISDNRLPIVQDLETAPGDGSITGPTGYTDLIEKSFWAAVIAGASMIGLFDHWFPPPSGGPHQMDNYMLQVDGNDPTGTPYGGTDAVRQKILAISTFVQTLGSAMLPIDTGLIVAYTSSNTTSGPVGAVYGVPLIYTTRFDGTHHYAFVQTIRPGATTATITIPSAASTTLTVLNQSSRTVSTNSSGVFTDTFTDDYEFHIYRW